MDRSENRNYSRRSTDRQIDMKENNGSEESQKNYLFNKVISITYLIISTYSYTVRKEFPFTQALSSQRLYT